MGRETQAIIAGNPRLYTDEHGVVRLQPQVAAFRAGLRRAAELLAGGTAVRVSVAMDHRGHFDDRFLQPGLGYAARRRPRLCHLRPEVRGVYLPFLLESGLTADQVWVLAEGTARLRGAHVAQTAPEGLRRQILTVPEPSAASDIEDLDAAPRVRCTGVAFAYYERASVGCVHLDVYWEDTPWSRLRVVQAGAVLANELGLSCTIRCVKVAGEHEASIPLPAQV